MAQKSKTAPPRETTSAREKPEKETPAAPSRAAPRRRWRILLPLLLLLLVAVYFAPTLVAITPLRQRILPMLFPLLAAKSHVGSASLGWFSSVVLYDVELTDLEDRPILAAPKVTSQHTLAGLILDQTYLGEFVIEQPTAHVLLRDDGNNIEDAIAPMINSKEPTRPKEYSLEISGGTIHVRQEAEPDAWRFTGLKVSLDLPLEGKQSVSASATLAPDGETHGGASTGTFSTHVAWRMPLPADNENGDTGTATIEFDQLPLEASRAAFRRFVGDVRVAGSASGKSRMSWNGQTGRFSLTVDELRGAALQASAPQWLAEDHVRLGELRMSGGMRVEGGAIAVEQFALECKSSFLDVRGSGTTREASLEVDCNLDKLAGELSRFVDLADVQLAGRLTTNVAWRRADDGRMTASGTAQLDQFAVELPGSRPWREEQLTAEFDAAGSFDDAGALDLDRGKLLVKSGQDLLDVELTAPVADVTTQSAFPIRGRFAGRIAAWLARVQLLLPLDGWQSDGTVELGAAGSVSLDGAELESLSGEISQFELTGAGLRIIEPRVVLDAKSLALRLGEAMFSAEDLTFSSSALAVRGTNVHAALNAQAPRVSGKLAVNSDLNRLAAWFDNPADPAPLDFYGSAFGDVTFEASSDSISTAVDLAATKFTVAQRPRVPGEALKALWQEPNVRIFGKATYDVKHASARLENATVQSNALQITASGKVADLQQRLLVELDGSVAYDLEQLAPVARPYLGDDFLLVGKSSEPFAIHGPVFASPPATTEPALAPAQSPVVSNELTASAGLAWSAIRVFEVDLGQGRFDAKLKQGVLAGSSLDLPVSGGRVRFAPSVLLNRQPMALVHPPAQVVERLQITPSMCRTWLKYVAPVMADATEVKGTFSTELDGAMVPILAPLDGQVKGRLAIHSAQVGPGPLGRQILALVRQLEATVKGRPLERLFALPQQDVWISMPDQTVEFQMAERGVRHERLTFVVGDVVVHTSGSVMFDREQSFDLVASIPIQDAWTEGGPLRARLRGKTLTIPLQGTLSPPSLDAAKALEGAARSLLQESPQKLLDEPLREQLKKGLQKLFD